jgi:hypothetical protein
MAVEYNERRGGFEIKRDPLTNEFIIDGVNNIKHNDKELSKLESKRKRLQLQIKKVEAEVADLEHNQNIFKSVTDIINGIPIEQYLILPTDDSKYGRYNFSSPVSGKYLHSWVNAHLDHDVMLSSDEIWCFSLHDGDYKETFLSRQYKDYPSDDGFSLDFVKLVAHEFVVNGKEIKDFYRNMEPWFKIFKRNKSLNSILDSE